MLSFFRRPWVSNESINMIRYRGRIAAFILLVWASFGWNMFGGGKPEETTTPSDGTGSSGSYRGLSGEELWSNNCLRCHNIRPPAMYSDAQWDVIVHHMRLRANITGQEQRAIVEFLKSAK
jgi:hypothetical protein